MSRTFFNESLVRDGAQLRLEGGLPRLDGGIFTAEEAEWLIRNRDARCDWRRSASDRWVLLDVLVTSWEQHLLSRGEPYRGVLFHSVPLKVVIHGVL